jgi:hypothetical protein
VKWSALYLSSAKSCFPSKLRKRKVSLGQIWRMGEQWSPKSLFVKEISEYLLKNVQVLYHEATQINPYFYTTMVWPAESLPQLFCHSQTKLGTYNFSFFNTLLMKDAQPQTTEINIILILDFWNKILMVWYTASFTAFMFRLWVILKSTVHSHSQQQLNLPKKVHYPAISKTFDAPPLPSTFYYFLLINVVENNFFLFIYPIS